MMKKHYMTPATDIIVLHPTNALLLVSGTGVPTTSTDAIGFDGVGGFFDEDEEVASRLLNGLLQ